MNIVWIVADSLRRDGLGCYGNPKMHTPDLDRFARTAMRFDKHYIGSFPTMPTRADHFTGRPTFTYMQWEPLFPGEVTLAQLLSQQGYHTAAMVDTPFYQRTDMNYDQGFQTFVNILGQHAKGPGDPHHEAFDVRAAWRCEADRCAPQTITAAERWLEEHHKEDFFLYVDTWDPHEPWDAPAYYTELYYPGYDGEIINPPYAYWQEIPWLTEEKVRKAYATYCGEISMVDRWVGHLLSKLEVMDLMDNTCVIFTSDHGFCFGEHGGLFGKGLGTRREDGSAIPVSELGDKREGWRRSPLWEEITHIPLLLYAPGVKPGTVSSLTSAVDLMPTVLDLAGLPVPDAVRGRSLAPLLRAESAVGPEFLVSSAPLSNVGDIVRQIDGFARPVLEPVVSTITTSEWSLMYSIAGARAELYNLVKDPAQQDDVIAAHGDVAAKLHQMFVLVLQESGVRKDLLEARLSL
jgi:arylsulfatase A-like enzyme